MKNATKTIYAMLFALLSLGVTSCSDDDSMDPIVQPGEESIDPANFQGTVNKDVRLNPNETYRLSGILSVEAGTTLTIPAGTKIVANTDSDDNPATGVYIVVQQGAKIDIQGTAAAPVVMSSASGGAGSWGGVVIAGKAKSTAGINAIAEVGSIIYGGDNPADNSGKVNYLVIKDAGAQIDPESQYNGLSLYGVGSGTSIQNVAIMNGADDGVEFFGGSVAVTNLYLENNEDDAVDWTEGWDGAVENVYVKHSIENFSTAIEADGANANPTITNFTAVSTTGGTALQFKKQSGATITGLYLSGYDTNIDITEDGRTDLSGIQIEEEDANLQATYNAGVMVDVAQFNWAL